MKSVSKDDISKYTLITTPTRIFVSGANVTGSVKIFPRLSTVERNNSPDPAEVGISEDKFSQYYDLLNQSCNKKRNANASIFNDVSNYFDFVNDVTEKSNIDVDVIRFTPSLNVGINHEKKKIVKNKLMPFYKSQYQHCEWAYSNYNSLNFFHDITGSKVDAASVLIYPNIADSNVNMPDGTFTGSYCLSGSFTFSFKINPRYNGLNAGGHFIPGTIMHLSSCYAVSLHTGSKKDANGNPASFRIALQLSHSADISPRLLSPSKSTYPHNLVFFTNDNSLDYNTWNDVVIRWGTDKIQNGTGSFIINDSSAGLFAITQSSINTLSNIPEPNMLCIGNYYEGTNLGLNNTSYFFDEDNASRNGVLEIADSAGTGWEGPANFNFRHPLRAEIHEICIRRKYMSDKELQKSGSVGLSRSDIKSKSLAFYLPPFYIERSPVRRVVNDRGGILQTPFFAIDGSTDDPINTAVALGVGGNYINLENFVKDFATNRFPRLLSMSGTTEVYTNDAITADEIFYDQPGVVRRNLTILPCDNGNFDPNFEILESEKFDNPVYHGSIQDKSLINLDNLVNTGSILSGGIGPAIQNSLNASLFGPSPEFAGLSPGLAQTSFAQFVSKQLSESLSDETFNRGIQKGSPLTIYNRLDDSSSNNVVFFDISNIFYGTRILPGSFIITDQALSGSGDCVKITIRDDSQGNLFRADSANNQWYKNGSVGNIFYDEGIVVIKNPHLSMFGKNSYRLEFKGVNPTFVTKYEIIAGAGELNSSSNLSNALGNIKPTNHPRDNENFVYISNINLHDENLNVVAKANFAQPVMKRESSQILFRIAIDQ